MSQKTRQEVLARFRHFYKSAGRKHKSKLIREAVDLLGYHSKAAIRALNWEGNPHDPDAKIGRTKDGATDMIYKPEAVVDLDTGAIVQADVHPGDQADHKEMATRVLEAQQTINQASGNKPDTLTVTSPRRVVLRLVSTIDSLAPTFKARH